MAVKHVHLPLSYAVSEVETMFAQHDPRTQAQLEKRRQVLADHQIEASADLNAALNDGFTIIAPTIIYSANPYQFEHYTLWKLDTKGSA